MTPISTETTLKLLGTWYLEVEGELTKSNLLCKLSVLELCGWIELEFDELVRKVASRAGCDKDWVESSVIGKTYGFKFDDHFRSMICKLVGESAACKVDAQMEAKFPGSLSRLKSLLGSLWKDRSAFAHSSLESNVSTQTTFRAPSWCFAQFKDIRTLIDHLDQSIDAALTQYLAPPKP